MWLNSVAVFKNVFISYEKWYLATVKKLFLFLAIKETEISDDMFVSYLDLF